MIRPPTHPPALVVLDRDGVVVRERDGWISEPSQLCFERDALTAVARLATAGVALAIATNQSGIGRGHVTAAAVSAVHASLRRRLREHGVELVGIYVCPHTDDAGCACRKPAPGLVVEAIDAAGTTADRTWVVGDMERDLLAGRAAGADVALVRTGKGRATEPTVADAAPVFDDLLVFADWILGATA